MSITKQLEKKGVKDQALECVESYFLLNHIKVFSTKYAIPKAIIILSRCCRFTLSSSMVRTRRLSFATCRRRWRISSEGVKFSILELRGGVPSLEGNKLVTSFKKNNRYLPMTNPQSRSVVSLHGGRVPVPTSLLDAVHRTFLILVHVIFHVKERFVGSRWESMFGEGNVSWGRLDSDEARILGQYRVVEHNLPRGGLRAWR